MFSLNCLAVLGCKCQEDEVFCFIKRFGPLSNGWTYGFLGCRIVLATLFIVVGNGFLVAFGNHESRSKSCISLSPKFLVPELLSMWRICCVYSILETSLLFYGHFHNWFVHLCVGFPGYTHEKLLASYTGTAYLVYCAILLILVAGHHIVYRLVCPCFQKLRHSVFLLWFEHAQTFSFYILLTLDLFFPI